MSIKYLGIKWNFETIGAETFFGVLGTKMEMDVTLGTICEIYSCCKN